MVGVGADRVSFQTVRAQCDRAPAIREIRAKLLKSRITENERRMATGAPVRFPSWPVHAGVQPVEAPSSSTAFARVRVGVFRRHRRAAGLGCRTAHARTRVSAHAQTRVEPPPARGYLVRRVFSALAAAGAKALAASKIARASRIRAAFDDAVLVLGSGAGNRCGCATRQCEKNAGDGSSLHGPPRTAV